MPVVIWYANKNVLMNVIKNTLSRSYDDLSIGDLMNCFEIIKDQLGLVYIKFDGVEEVDFYSVIIHFPRDPQSLWIEAQHPTLKESMYDALVRFIAARPDPTN